MGSNHYDKRNKYSDEYLVGLYLEYGSQIEAAKHIDVSRETIARAVRRSGVLMTGKGQRQSGRKITDNELIEESKLCNCLEIARKHGMSYEQVVRRAARLGIKLIHKNIGGHWFSRAIRYGSEVDFDTTITLKNVRSKYNDICQVCGKRVDDSDISNGHIRRMYPTVDHIIPLSKGGTHTWDNVQLAHMCCNSGKGDRVREEVIA